MGIYRKVESLTQLPRGTIVKHVNDDRTFVVVANYGSRVTAVANVDITRPPEWLWFDEKGTQGKT